MMSKEKEREFEDEEEGFYGGERSNKALINGDSGKNPLKKMKFSDPNCEDGGGSGGCGGDDSDDGSGGCGCGGGDGSDGDGDSYDGGGGGGDSCDGDSYDGDSDGGGGGGDSCDGDSYDGDSDGGGGGDDGDNDGGGDDDDDDDSDGGGGGGGVDSVGGGDGDGEEEGPQDADYNYVPSLTADLENLILARVPRSEYWKFSFVNKRYLSVLKSGDIYKIRKESNGLREASVFMLAGSDANWWAYDRQFRSRRKLPYLPTDYCFTSGDKETLCAGTHLIVTGKEVGGAVVWRYELAMNKWEKGPSMINPRCLYASATCGTFAFFAGGIGMGSHNNKEVLSAAEKYNPEDQSWKSLPRMKQRRRSCSGCYMDNKFYVIGGRDEKGKDLTCGEAYDEKKNSWVLIPDMLKGCAPISTSQSSPPLLAVVNNELYSLEASSNELKFYLKKSNTWKNLGQVPVRANCNLGWGVAFKSLGDELLVIGAAASTISNAGHGMTIYTCRPDPNAADDEELQWRPIDNGNNRLSHFIHNCCVMVA